MNILGNAWLLDKLGNCIEVYAHPSESFEFDSIVDLVSKFGSESDKNSCMEWNSTKSDTSKNAVLNSYNLNWCRVRLWNDNQLTFRISAKDYDWYRVIVDFLRIHTFVSSAVITVSDLSGKIYWDGVSYNYCIDPSNEKSLSRVFMC